MAKWVSATGRQEQGGEAVDQETPTGLPISAAAADSAVQAVTNTSVPTEAARGAAGSMPVESIAEKIAMVPRVIYPFGWSRRDVRRALALALAAAVAAAFLWQIQAILPPFLIAFFLAALLDPTLRYMERHGHSRVRAILLLYLLGLLLIILTFIAIVPTVTNQVEEISRNIGTYWANIQQSADEYIQRHATLLSRFNIKQQHISEILSQNAGPVQGKITAALGGVTMLLSGAFSKAFWLVIIPLSAFFFMRDYPFLRARIIALFPETYHKQIDVMSREIVDVFSAYIRGLAKICALYAGVAVILFSLLGLKYALFLGLAAGVFYAVPYVGQLFTAIATGSVAFMMDKHTVLFFFQAQTHSSTYVLTVVVCAILVQNLFDQIVYPRIVGGSVGLHPVVSIFSLMAGATLFGIWGILVAVPVAASLQIILTYAFPKLTQAPPQGLLESPPPLV
jgi:predicted PurR-regulated permease PerM